METPQLSMSMRVRLSLMMFLQFAIWGAWLPILYPFLLGHVGYTLDQVGMILAAGAVGAIFGPFIAGQVADRYFATEKFLGISHLIGAALVYALSLEQVASKESFVLFLAISLLYGLIYAPTLALTNSLCFHHLTDRDRQFGPIRLWGTIGWIVAGIAVGHWLLAYHTPSGVEEDAVAAAQNAGRVSAFRLSAILGAIMGLYCFTLPHTPPATTPRQSNATFEALGEVVRRRPLIVLFLLAIPISVIHQFYFVHTSEFLSVMQRSSEAATGFADKINRIFGVGGGGLMTIGQMSEILVLAAIPFLAKALSRKWLLAIGILAYAGRMALFAYTDSIWLILLGVALHGLCFGCFIFVAFMIVDEETTADVRASAQNLFNLVIVGIGIIVGSWFATSIVASAATTDQGTDFTYLFSVPMWMALACLVLLLIFYPGGKQKSIGGTREVVEPVGGAVDPDD